MPAVTVRRRSSTLPLVLAILFIGFLVVVAGFVIYLLLGGQVTVPFTDPPRVLSFSKQEEVRRWEEPKGLVRIPTAGRPIAAFARVSRDDLWDLSVSRGSAIYLPKEQVGSDWILDQTEIQGRVMARDKGKGYVFTEADFMPKGTREGIVAGIPPGMRSVRVNLETVRGFYDLRPGDRFDLISTIALDNDPSDELKKIGGPHATRLALEAAAGNLGKQAIVNVIVQNGVLVAPARTVHVPISGGSLNDPHGVRTRPIQEVVVAVAPEEVARLTEAMAVGADIEVVSRSGHPDDPKDSVTPSSRPWTPFSGGEAETAGDAAGKPAMQFVETISGGKREVVPVPTKDGEK